MDGIELFWFNPRKYWTVSKNERSLQDHALDIVDKFLENDKDVVIVTDKEYRWRNKNPCKAFYRHETAGHIVFCTRELKKLSGLVGPSADEQLLNTAIASCYMLRYALLHPLAARG